MMAIAAETVGLRMDGAEWSAFTSVEITHGIQHMARSASLSISAIDPRKQQLLRIAPDMDCEIRIGDTPIITGVVDDDDLSPKEGAKFTVQARSLTRDICDCTVEHRTGVFPAKMRVERIAQELCDAYGIEVVCDVDTGDALATAFVASKKEKVYQALARLGAERGLLFVDDAQGRLHITSVNPNGAVVATIERGYQYEELTRHRTSRERFSRYNVNGQSAAEVDAAGQARDFKVRRNRVLTLDNERSADSAACLRRAKWEAAVRAGRSVRYTATVPGWRIDPTDSKSALWEANTLVNLVDPVWEIDDVVLVSEVKYLRSAGDGTRTTLQLGYPIGYLTEPPRVRKTSRKRSKSAALVDYFDEEGAE